MNIVLPLRVGVYEKAGKIYYSCPLSSVFFLLVVVMRHSTLPFPTAKAMDVKNQFLFLFILASFTNSQLENAHLHNIADKIKITANDCKEMRKNSL